MSIKELVQKLSKKSAETTGVDLRKRSTRIASTGAFSDLMVISIQPEHLLAPIMHCFVLGVDAGAIVPMETKQQECRKKENLLKKFPLKSALILTNTPLAV